MRDFENKDSQKIGYFEVVKSGSELADLFRVPTIAVYEVECARHLADASHVAPYVGSGNGRKKGALAGASSKWGGGKASEKPLAPRHPRKLRPSTPPLSLVLHTAHVSSATSVHLCLPVVIE